MYSSMGFSRRYSSLNINLQVVWCQVYQCAVTCVYEHISNWVCVCNCNLLGVTGAALSCWAGPHVSHRGSMGKAIHLRTAQGIVSHCSEDKVRALQRVSTEWEPLVPFYTTYNNATTEWTNRINRPFFHPCAVTLRTKPLITTSQPILAPLLNQTK